MKATAAAHSNIAFAKYWGRLDPILNLPCNDSLSMNLSAATTSTTVEFSAAYERDTLVIDGLEASEPARVRVSRHLDHVRDLAELDVQAKVMSENTFPMGAGIASSASAFAALALAACHAAGLDLSERELSALARLGSGSACRSVPGGFVRWTAGDAHDTSYARQIAPPDHWDLYDVIAIVSKEPKAVGSTVGHAAAQTSPYFQARLETLPERLETVQKALRARDLEELGLEIEAEAISLHVIAMTSRPPIYYWAPGTVRLIRAVQRWREDGVAAYYTLDAGPNVHLICSVGQANEVERRLRAVPEVQDVLVNRPAGGAHLTEKHLF